MEQEMFHEFADEVQSLSTASQTMMQTSVGAANTAPAGQVLKRVRKTYHETVMSTPDFEDEYGESFQESVATEFGDDVAALLIDGHQLNGPLKGLLVQQAR